MRTTTQAVPKNPRIGIESYSPGYKATGTPREASSLTHAPHFPVASRLGDSSGVVLVSSRTVSLRY
jgi:hypothetical protein